MVELLLEKDLLASSPGSEVRTIARARTLTVLLQLDGVRKGSLIRFLWESELILGPGPVILLGDAILRGSKGEIVMGQADLTDAQLNRVFLTEVNLTRVTLNGADLRGSFLRDANLNGASLRGADLRGTTLIGAKLLGADLIGADLRGANLSGADLRGANVTDEQLAEVGSLELAMMPDGTRHE